MKWTVEFTDEFEKWWNSLTEAEQTSITASVELLEDLGPKLGYPHTSGMSGSRHPHMRELRTQHAGRMADRLYDEHLESLRKEHGQKFH